MMHLGGPLKGAAERRCTYDANGHDNILDLRKIRMYLLTVIIKKKKKKKFPTAVIGFTAQPKED